MSYKVKIGIDEKGKDFLLDFGKTTNLILRGSTGGGKSICLHTIIKRILEQDKNVEFILFDSKTIEFSRYKGIPNINVVSSWKTEEVLPVLNKLCEEQNKLKKDIFVIFDELSDYYFFRHRPLDKPLLKLIDNNKNKKVHLLISSQMSYGPRKINPKISDRLGFCGCNLADSLSMIGKGGCEYLKGRGDCIAKIDGKLTHFQVDWIWDEIKEFVNSLKK